MSRNIYGCFFICWKCRCTKYTPDPDLHENPLFLHCEGTHLHPTPQHWPGWEPSVPPLWRDLPPPPPPLNIDLDQNPLFLHCEGTHLHPTPQHWPGWEPSVPPLWRDPPPPHPPPPTLTWMRTLCSSTVKGPTPSPPPTPNTDLDENPLFLHCEGFLRVVCHQEPQCGLGGGEPFIERFQLHLKFHALGRLHLALLGCRGQGLGHLTLQLLLPFLRLVQLRDLAELHPRAGNLHTQIPHKPTDWLIDDLLIQRYSPLSWADSLHSHAILHEWPAFFIARFWISTEVVYLSADMAGAAWNCCHLGASSVYTIHPCTVSLHAKPHT